MEKTVVRYLFSELPYGAALHTKYLQSRCSSCFSDIRIGEDSNANFACNANCAFVKYCGESCREKDRPFHEYECLAVRRGNRRVDRPLTELAIRLLARLLARYRLDEGIASLSKDFPSEMVEDRRFDDLMTHKNDIRRSPRHEALFRETEIAFFAFFSGTPMASTTLGTLFRFFCRYTINGFVVNVRVRPQPGCCEALGEAVYLNASRFNHSCSPACSYVFDGCRLIIKYYDEEKEDDSLDDESTFAKRPNLTKKEFESLTLHYGFGTYWNYGTACQLAEQRIPSLESRYFFRCRCDLCSDKRLNEIQLNAAPVECSLCSWPYVWSRSLFGSLKLKKTCQCRHDKRTKEREFESAPWLLKVGAEREAKKLLSQWKSAMSFARDSKDFRDTIATCTPVLRMAEKYWHSKYNLRLGQLNEKIFDAFWLYAFGPDYADDTTVDDLNSAIYFGEAMLKVYRAYVGPTMLTIAAYAQNLGLLYKVRSDEPDDADDERSQFWYAFAIDMWKRRGELGCARFVQNQAAAPAPWKMNPRFDQS